MEKDLITIIVPVFNVLKYLPKCLNSILCQTYTNIEVIVVDDGSTDGSEVICDDFAIKDSRIKVIHQSNQGLSEARNVGLTKANGEYIGFVDSDDWISHQMYERMYGELIKNRADIAACGKYTATDKGVYLKKQGYSDTTKVLTRKEALISLATFKEISNSACDKLYRKSTLLVNPFPQGRYYEDLYSMSDILNRCNKIVYIDTPYYYYYLRENSITHTFSAKHLMHHFEAAIYQNKKIEINYPELKPLAQKSQIVYNTVLYLSLIHQRKRNKDVELLADAIVEDMKKYPYSLMKSVAVKYLPGAFLLKYFSVGFSLYAFAFEALKFMVIKEGINRISFKKVSSLLN